MTRNPNGAPWGTSTAESEAISRTAPISQIILECSETTAERTKEMNPQHNISNLRSQLNAIYILNRPQQIIGREKVMKTVAARAMPRQIDTEIFRPSPPPQPDTQLWLANRIPIPNDFACIFLSPIRRILTDHADVTVTPTYNRKVNLSNLDPISTHVCVLFICSFHSFFIISTDP